MPLCSEVRQYGLEASPQKSWQLVAPAQWVEWASAGLGGSGRALCCHVDGGQVNLTACHLRVMSNHALSVARHDTKDILQFGISVPQAVM